MFHKGNILITVGLESPDKRLLSRWLVWLDVYKPWVFVRVARWQSGPVLESSGVG